MQQNNAAIGVYWSNWRLKESPIGLHMHILGFWEEAVVIGGNPLRHGENMQTLHRNTLSPHHELKAHNHCKIQLFLTLVIKMEIMHWSCRAISINMSCRSSSQPISCLFSTICRWASFHIHFHTACLPACPTLPPPRTSQSTFTGWCSKQDKTATDFHYTEEELFDFWCRLRQGSGRSLHWQPVDWQLRSLPGRDTLSDNTGADPKHRRSRICSESLCVVRVCGPKAEGHVLHVVTAAGRCSVPADSDPVAWRLTYIYTVYVYIYLKKGRKVYIIYFAFFCSLFSLLIFYDSLLSFPLPLYLVFQSKQTQRD